METFSDFLAKLENSICNLNLFLTVSFAKQLLGPSGNVYTVNLCLFFHKRSLYRKDSDLSHLLLKGLLFLLNWRRVVLTVLLLFPLNKLFERIVSLKLVGLVRHAW